MSVNNSFSNRLEKWLTDSKPKTLGSLQRVFGEKAFAMGFLLLMFIPSLPIPTGGITHIFLEPITFLLAVEMIFGRRTIWLPKFLKKRPLGALTEKKALPFMVRRVQWFEKFSRPRMSSLLEYTFARTFIGIIVLLLNAAAFISPPFSGLDTLPSLGIVIIALSMILEDIVLLGMGIAVGAVGIGLVFASGALISNLFGRLF